MNKNGAARRAPLLCAAPRKADKAAAAYALFASKAHPGAVQKESYPCLDALSALLMYVQPVLLCKHIGVHCAYLVKQRHENLIAGVMKDKAQLLLHAL